MRDDLAGRAVDSGCGDRSRRRAVVATHGRPGLFATASRRPP
jgi:hypothetical protein